MTDVAWDVALRDAIVVARFRNPPTGYFTSSALRQLRKEIRAWRDPAVRAIVITGDEEGRFITHFAVEELVHLARDTRLAESLGTTPVDRVQATLQELSELEKPVLAAMGGDTMGVGLELALACDIRIAERGDVRIGFPETALGILAAGGGTQRLARTIGAARALDFLLRSMIVTPERALELGIVNELADDPLDRALEIAARLLQAPAAALAQTKRAVLAGADLSLAAGLRLEAQGWLATMVAGTAAAPMEDFLARGGADRRDWIEQHGAG